MLPLALCLRGSRCRIEPTLRGAGRKRLDHASLRRPGALKPPTVRFLPPPHTHLFAASQFPEVRKHVQRVLGDAYPASEFDLSIETFPADDVTDPKAYVQALDALPRGSIVTIFTPDDTHFAIAMDAVTRGMHVLVTKPAVKTLEEHQALHRAAEEAKVLVAVEVHKRWDPIYQDARDRLRGLGDMSYLSAYMSQPKRQLRTFGAWAGRSSDISYYLNSHHVGEPARRAAMGWAEAGAAGRALHAVGCCRSSASGQSDAQPLHAVRAACVAPATRAATSCAVRACASRRSAMRRRPLCATWLRLELAQTLASGLSRASRARCR